MKRTQKLIYKMVGGKYFLSVNKSLGWLFALLLSVFVVTTQCDAVHTPNTSYSDTCVLFDNERGVISIGVYNNGECSTIGPVSPIHDLDLDGDGYTNDVDNCPLDANTKQADRDNNGMEIYAKMLMEMVGFLL